MPERLARIPSLDAAYQWLKSPISRAFHGYYTDLHRKRGALPYKADIDPIGLKPCLSHMVIMDCVVPAEPRYRLAGDAYIQMLGTNPMGKPYLDFVPPERRAVASEAYVVCMRHRCGMLTEIVTVTKTGREILCEALNLPVREKGAGTGDGGSPVRFLYVTLSPFGEERWGYDEARSSQYREVRFRGFIDLGFGTPQTFGGTAIR